MKAENKKMLKGLCDLVEKAGEFFEVEDVDFKKILKMELAKYLMYLSASDGEIKWIETRIINDVLEIDLNPTVINEFITDENVYSVEFESTVPAIMKFLVELDNAMYENDNSMDTFAGELLIDLYKAIGAELVLSDDDLDSNEKTDINIYIDMLESYLNDNLLARNVGIKFNNTKVNGNIKAPTKSGVSAPKKG